MGIPRMKISMDHLKLIEFLRAEIGRRHPHKKPPYYFSKRVKEGNLTRTALIDFLDDPVVGQALRYFCSEIDTDWDAPRITEVLMGNSRFEAGMRASCEEIALMINEYLRTQTE